MGLKGYEMNLVLLCHLTTAIDSHKATQYQSGFPIKSAAAVSGDRGRGQGTIGGYTYSIHVWQLGIASANSICSNLTGCNLLHLSQLYQILFSIWAVFKEDSVHTHNLLIFFGCNI